MNIITGKAISRRTLLRGMGAGVALPFLEAMIPTRMLGQSAPPRPHRFQAFYVPNGMAMEYWTPSGQDATSSRCAPVWLKRISSSHPCSRN